MVPRPSALSPDTTTTLTVSPESQDTLYQAHHAQTVSSSVALSPSQHSKGLGKQMHAWMLLFRSAVVTSIVPLFYPPGCLENVFAISRSYNQTRARAIYLLSISVLFSAALSVPV